MMHFAIVLVAVFTQVLGQGVPFGNNQLRPVSTYQYQGYAPTQTQATVQQQVHADAVQVNNEQLLAIAAANGLDVEAIRQNLLAGRPVEIEINQVVQTGRPQTQPQQPQPQLQQQPQKSLNTPQGIFVNYQNLLNTAADPRIKQMLQTPEFQKWHSKLIQSNPNIVNIRHGGAPTAIQK